MPTDLITGVFTFRKGVYGQVEQDSSFTQTAWIIVAVTAFLSALGQNIRAGLVNGIVGAIVGTILALIGFFVGCLVIGWVGRTVFHAEVTTEELQRTLGLAYIWNIVGVLGFIPCLGGIIIFVAGILGLIAWFMAAKEALDLDWVQTIITVIIGWIIVFVFTLLAGVILGALGYGVSAVTQ